MSSAELDHDAARKTLAEIYEAGEMASYVYGDSAEPDSAIELPDFNQDYDYDCGAIASMSVGKYFGVGPETKEDWRKLLGTNREDSTKPERIVEYFKSQGLEVEDKHNMSLEDLHDYWRRGMPVICLVQEYGIQTKQQPYGHFVIVIGLPLDYVLVQDPSIDNVVAHDDVDEAPGRMVIYKDKWMKIWWDTQNDKTYTKYGIAIGKSTEKKSASVLGIPSRTDYGDLSQLQAGQLVNWIVQHHQARRAGAHYDMRLGTPETGLFSWAARKELPEPGKKILAVQQPLHSHEYGQFEGEIPQGYGAGTVRKHDEGRLLLTKVEPGKVHFTMAHKKYPERYVLVKTPKMGEDKWLLMNTTPTKMLPYGKAHFQTIPGDKVEDVLSKIQSGTSVQEKIDGAASLSNLLKDKIELLSYRQSKVTGGPIVHTERAFHTVPQLTVPKEYQGSVLRGELYGTRDNQAIPAQELGGLLNSGVAKSLEDQAARNIQMKNMVYDVQQLGKKPISNETTPYPQRLDMLHKIIGSIGGPDKNLVSQMYHLPTEAKTPEEALSMWQAIKNKQNPRTDEGVVIHPPLGTPRKAKAFEESDVFIRGFFPGKGKYENKGVGGFVYSHSPKGHIVGEVGTGFDDAMRQAMFENEYDYVGRKARIQHTGKLPSGALFQPSLLSLHEDYPAAKVIQ